MRADTFRSTAKTHRHHIGTLSTTVASHPSNPIYGVFRESEEDFFDLAKITRLWKIEVKSVFKPKY